MLLLYRQFNTRPITWARARENSQESKESYFQDFTDNTNSPYKSEQIRIIQQWVPGLSDDVINRILENDLDAVYQLRSTLKQSTINNMHKTFGLLILAKYFPLNTDCHIDLCEINQKDSVFVSTGHQYNLQYLIDHYLTVNNMAILLNPRSGEPMDELTKDFILNLAVQRRVKGYERLPLLENPFSKLYEQIRGISPVTEHRISF